MTEKLRGVTAKKTAYSSVVGQSVQLIAPDGRMLALIMIGVPSPGLDYRAHAEPIADRIVAAFNGAPK